LSPTDAQRYYVFNLHNIPAGETVRIAFCGRLSRSAGDYGGGASLHVNVANGAGNQDIAINPRGLLELPQLTVIKDVVGSAEDASTFQMQILNSADSSLVHQFAGDAAGTTYQLQPGTYSVDEVDDAEYTMSFVDATTCQNIVMALADVAESYTCTITNTYVAPVDPDADIIVIKELVNAPLGTEQSDFTFTINRSDRINPSPNNVFLNSPSFVDIEAVPNGTGYSIVEEPVPADYTVSYSQGCEGTIANGVDVTCTVTNTYNAPLPATIIINKVLPNNDGGLETISDFEFFVDSTEVIEGTENEFAAGTYTITEAWVNAHPGEVITDRYTVTYSSSCSGGVVTLDPGEEVVCTITNDDLDAEVTVIKNVVGGPLGVVPPASAFSMIVDGDISGFAQFNGDENGTVVGINAGGFEVREVADPNYADTYDGFCGDQDLVPGQNAVCTVTNTYIGPDQATITITKSLPNDDGGLEQTGDFDFTLNGSPAAIGANVVSAGTYTVAEAWAVAHPGDEISDVYSVTFSGDCDENGVVTVAVGDDLTCTITNDDRPATTLTVNKIVENHGVGTATPANFTLTIGGQLATWGVPVVVEPGALIEIDEAASVLGYQFVSITGDAECPTFLAGNAVLEEGDVVTCTITNEFILPDTDPTDQILLLDPCIGPGADGRLIAQFGYDSDNAGTVIIPVGTFNLLGGDSTRIPTDSPVTSFLPGLNENAFTVDFDEALTVSWTVDWDMDGLSPAIASASSGSRLCTPPARIDLVVRKIVVNNGGSAVPSDFTLEVTGTDVSLDGGVTTSSSVQFPGDELGTTITLAEGDYTVTELNGTGFEVVSFGDCSGIATTVGDLECQITNTEITTPPPSDGGGSSGGGGGGSIPRRPPPVVLGDSDEADDTDDEVVEEDDVVVTPPPTPVVEGTTDELPRTGLPLAGVLALGSVLTFLARRKQD
jgi:hypothetical protein